MEKCDIAVWYCVNQRQNWLPKNGIKRAIICWQEQKWFSHLVCGAEAAWWLNAASWSLGTWQNQIWREREERVSTIRCHWRRTWSFVGFEWRRVRWTFYLFMLLPSVWSPNFFFLAELTHQDKYKNFKIKKYLFGQGANTAHFRAAETRISKRLFWSQRRHFNPFLIRLVFLHLLGMFHKKIFLPYLCLGWYLIFLTPPEQIGEKLWHFPIQM